MKTRVIFIYVVPYGAPAWELNTFYALTMKKYGIESAFLAHGIEDGCKDFPVPVHPYKFHDFRLDAATKKFILDFNPDIIHLCSPRFLAIRVVLEALMLTNAELIVKHEDEEIFIATQDHISVSPRKAFEPGITASLNPERLQALFSTAAWPFMFKEWFSKPSMMLAEPVSFGIINHLASGFIGIWHNVTKELAQTYCKPAWTMPPTFELNKIRTDRATKKEMKDAEKELNIPSDKKILLFSGKYYPLVFDFDLMLHILSCEDLKADNSWHFVVTGDNPHVERHQKIIRSAGIGRRITWLGNISKEKLDKVVRRADIVLSPGLINEYNRVRLPQKNVMYMSYGKAMITFSTGFGESLANGENALLVASDSPSKWSAEILKLLHDEPLREKLEKNARKFAEIHFDCDNTAEGLANFYHSINANRTKDMSLSAKYAGNPELLIEASFKSRELQNCRKIALFGAGKHTVRILNSCAMEHIRDKELIIADENPRQKALEGIRIIHLNELEKWNPDGIILSTDSYEDQMLRKCLDKFKRGPAIFRIYSPPHVIYPEIYHIQAEAGKLHLEDIGAAKGPALNAAALIGLASDLDRIDFEKLTDETVRKQAFVRLPPLKTSIPFKFPAGTKVKLIEVSCSGLNFVRYIDSILSDASYDAFAVYHSGLSATLASSLWNELKNMKSDYIFSDWDYSYSYALAIKKGTLPVS
ncbi:MAG: hypothetical protein A2017_07555 [Lentisphaerae bacterium GWF2_44_16]|nr:MAG: hypothetical protein A2017_07555 [Lentisphaerae bacterium GWF2_44_16]